MPADGSIPGKMPWELLKLETWILAAPDLDMQVFNQRFFGENLIRAANRVIVYFSSEDKALDWARWLFNSRQRIGELKIADIPPDALAKIAQIGQIQLINAQVTGHSSHSYIMQHPAAMSDLLLLLRDSAAAGSPSRPLGVAAPGVWLLDNDYMNADKPTPKNGTPKEPPSRDASFMDG
jgi:esterase/lipase superfamily enzyme